MMNKVNFKSIRISNNISNGSIFHNLVERQIKIAHHHSRTSYPNAFFFLVKSKLKNTKKLVGFFSFRFNLRFGRKPSKYFK